eukprot:c51431_g1_i1 orf=17-238(-)
MRWKVLVLSTNGRVLSCIPRVYLYIAYTGSFHSPLKSHNACSATGNLLGGRAKYEAVRLCHMYVDIFCFPAAH